MNKHKLIRITTVPLSLKTLLKGQLKYMKEQGWEVQAITSNSESIQEIIDNENVDVHTIEMTRQITPLKDLKAVWQLYKFFKKEKPTIVHTHTPKAGIVGMLASRLAGVPIRLHTVAGLPLLVATGIKRKVLNFVEALTYKCATGVYPNSKGLYDIIIQEKLAPAHKLKVIGNGSSNGINTSHFNPELISESSRQALKSQYKIHDDDVVLIFVGRIVGDKGINELTQAFNALSPSYPHLKLMVVGDFEKDLDPVSKDTEHILNTHPNIILTGFQKDVRPFLAISHILVFPSYREGFPNVVMQAGAMGLPAIVSNINGCNEIIISEENGIIIPVKDAQAISASIERLLQNKNLYKQMQSQARTYIVNRYEQQVIWQALHQEYVTLLDSVYQP